MLNEQLLRNTKILVKQGAVTTQSFNTGNKSDFKVQLDFGNRYQIWFQHERAPLMFMEVWADNVPQDKFEYRMTYELNVPFVDRRDEDVDTLAYKKAFHRVIYNGKSKMVDDAAYNEAFAKTIIKKEEVAPAPPKEEKTELPSIVAGKACLSGDKKIPLINKHIFLIGPDGKVLRNTYTNRFGAFVFTNVLLGHARSVRLEGGMETGNSAATLFNSAGESVGESMPVSGVYEWTFGRDKFFKLVDNQYTTNIGGKLIASSAKAKKFYTDQNVYLSNKLNTVVQQTKTSKLGTFVFEDIKPDHEYFIGVDKGSIAPGEKIDMLSKEDRYVGTLDSITGNRSSLSMNSDYNKAFNEVSISEEEIKMDVKGTIFGDNVNSPIGRLKIVLLNDQYEIIDSTITSDLGAFKFKYLPFLKRFYLSAENNDNILDVFKNILIYSSDENLIKVMTHQKGAKFKYQPVSTEITKLRDIEIDDPWLNLVEPAPSTLVASTEKNVPPPAPPKAITENILFETAKYDITDASKEILDKIILVLYSNKALRIEVGAHTDSKGSEASNLRLSELRAATVKKYITNAGIDASRILTKGYGESKLLNNCYDDVECSEVEHAQNRRIEFKILGE
jgi:outer membrane protein OmpA-like peptidoglycan-associated protein